LLTRLLESNVPMIFYLVTYKLIHKISINEKECDVEDTIHAFLKQKSQCKIKGGAIEAIRATVSELHEIL